MKEIQLSQGRVALVDDDDFEKLNHFNWWVHRSGNSLYAVRSVWANGKNTMHYMHCDILNGKGIDHIDQNGCNNQKSNLRFCTKSENQMNARKRVNCTSIYKGVCLRKSIKKWESSIRINGKTIHLGYFISEIEAAKVYNAKAIELFCEFANLNIIPNEQ